MTYGMLIYFFMLREEQEVHLVAATRIPLVVSMPLTPLNRKAVWGTATLLLRGRKSMMATLPRKN